HPRLARLLGPPRRPRRHRACGQQAACLHVTRAAARPAAAAACAGRPPAPARELCQGHLRLFGRANRPGLPRGRQDRAHPAHSRQGRLVDRPPQRPRRHLPGHVRRGHI
ncbi:hypothetical protein IWQ57_006733, partial [Coemansia nantahalensis]